MNISNSKSERHHGQPGLQANGQSVSPMGKFWLMKHNTKISGKNIIVNNLNLYSIKRLGNKFTWDRGVPGVIKYASECQGYQILKAELASHKICRLNFPKACIKEIVINL